MSEEPRPKRELTTSQKQVIGFVIVLAVVSAVYRLVYYTGYAKSAGLYVGVPAVLAIGLARLPRAKSATGMIMRGSTLAMLIATVAVPEGLLCLLFALPLVALISVIVGGTVDVFRRRRGETGDGPALMSVGLPLLILSLEGVVGSPFPSQDVAVAHRLVEARPAEVRRVLAAPPSFSVTQLPTFLKVGFNKPVDGSGSGLHVGATRTIEFTGGTHDDHPLRLFGITGERSVHHHASMTLRVAESRPGRVVFRVVEDGTMLSRWVDLDRAVVTWRAVPGGTEVRWSLDYRRLLYPTAYFGPLQRFGMGEAADYLLAAVVVDPLS